MWFPRRATYRVSSCRKASRSSLSLLARCLDSGKAGQVRVPALGQPPEKLRVVANDDRVGVLPPARIGLDKILFLSIPLEVQPKKLSKKWNAPSPRLDRAGGFFIIFWPSFFYNKWHSMSMAFQKKKNKGCKRTRVSRKRGCKPNCLPLQFYCFYVLASVAERNLASTRLEYVFRSSIKVLSSNTWMEWYECGRCAWSNTSQRHCVRKPSML